MDPDYFHPDTISMRSNFENSALFFNQNFLRLATHGDGTDGRFFRTGSILSCEMQRGDKRNASFT